MLKSDTQNTKIWDKRKSVYTLRNPMKSKINQQNNYYHAIYIEHMILCKHFICVYIHVYFELIFLVYLLC